jgi:hypothetical protein
MSHHPYLNRLAASLRASGCTIEEGVRLERRYFSLVAHRSRMAFMSVVPYFAEECFIATYSSKLTRDKLLDLMTDCSDYAVHYSPPRSLLKRLVGSVSTVYCIVLADEESSDCTNFVKQTPKLLPWALVVPVVIHLPTGEVHSFKKCPILSGAIYREARKVIRKQFDGLPTEGVDRGALRFPETGR